jgi:cell wall assembly regulator SMI1
MLSAMSNGNGLLVHATAPTGPFDVAVEWARIAAAADRIWPGLSARLAPPAPATAIEAFERAIGRPLPDEVRASFAVHDGQVGGSPFFHGMEFMSLEQCRAQWELSRSFDPGDVLWPLSVPRVEGSLSFPEGAIAAEHASPARVPLIDADGSQFIGVDLAPGPAGVVGQVITFARDQAFKQVLAWGWGAFLSDLAAELARPNFRHPPAGHWEGLILIDPRPPRGEFCSVVDQWAAAKLGR